MACSKIVSDVQGYTIATQDISYEMVLTRMTGAPLVYGDWLKINGPC
jgi:hypothetical protein